MPDAAPVVSRYKPISRYYPSNLSSFGFISLTIINSDVAQDDVSLEEAREERLEKI